MRALRLAVDLLVVCSALGAATFALFVYQERLDRASAVDATRAAVARLASEIGVRSTLGTAELNACGYPSAIDRGWFCCAPPEPASLEVDPEVAADGPARLAEAPPVNSLANARAPWIEYALPGELSRDHPRVPTFRGGRGAMFWYNPSRGVIRARVPESASDETDRALYAEVNGVEWE